MTSQPSNDTVAQYTRLAEASFTDLYLGHAEGSYFTDFKGSLVNPTPAPESLKGELDTVLQLCTKHYAEMRARASDETDFRIEHDTKFYRVAVFTTVGAEVFVVRKVEQGTPTLESLGMPEVYRSLLLAPDLTGLLLIAGQMGAGKTTSAYAMMTDRLRRFGGVGVTAENPPEMAIEGRHGPGIVFQTAVTTATGGFASATRRLARSGADIILLGEVRDPEGAVEALRAAINGCLVLATIHAEDIVTALRRIHALASGFYEPDAVNALLSDGLAMVVHQRLNDSPNGGRRRLQAEVLQVRNHTGTINKIRSGRFERLGDDLNVQSSKIQLAVR